MTKLPQQTSYVQLCNSWWQFQPAQKTCCCCKVSKTGDGSAPNASNKRTALTKHRVILMCKRAEHILPAAAPEGCCAAQGLSQHTLPPVKVLAGAAPQVAWCVVVVAAAVACCRCCCCCCLCLRQHQPHAKLCKPRCDAAEGLRTQQDLCSHKHSKRTHSRELQF